MQLMPRDTVTERFTSNTAHNPRDMRTTAVNM